MALTADQLAYLRSELGASPDDADLNAAYTRLGTVEAVALETVRTRLATLLADPASFSVPDYSQSTSANIAALTAQAERLQQALDAVEGVGVFSVGRLERLSPGR